MGSGVTGWSVLSDDGSEGIHQHQWLEHIFAHGAGAYPRPRVEGCEANEYAGCVDATGDEALMVTIAEVSLDKWHYLVGVRKLESFIHGYGVAKP